MESSERGGLFELLEMIKFSHTIFALPFALTGMVLAAGGLPSFGVIFWVIVAIDDEGVCDSLVSQSKT